jgi:hypothetical protein
MHADLTQAEQELKGARDLLNSATERAFDQGYFEESGNYNMQAYEKAVQSAVKRAARVGDMVD